MMTMQNTKSHAKHARLSPEQKKIIAITRDQLTEAVRVMKMQPLTQRDRPSRLQAFWVAYGNSGDASAQYRQPPRPKASPAQITAMERMLDGLLALGAEQRKIVMARAGGIPWRRLEEIDGRSHTTLRKVEASALLALAKAVLAENKNAP